MAGSRLSMRTANQSVPNYFVDQRDDKPIEQIANAVQTAYSVLGGDKGLAARVASWFGADDEDYNLSDAVTENAEDPLKAEATKKAEEEMAGYTPLETTTDAESAVKAQEAMKGYKPSMTWDADEDDEVSKDTTGNYNNDEKTASSYGRRR